MVLIQPQGEPETNVRMLQDSWDKVMKVPDAPAAAATRTKLNPKIMAARARQIRLNPRHNTGRINPRNKVRSSKAARVFILRSLRK